MKRKIRGLRNLNYYRAVRLVKYAIMFFLGVAFSNAMLFKQVKSRISQAAKAIELAGKVHVRAEAYKGQVELVRYRLDECLTETSKLKRP